MDKKLWLKVFRDEAGIILDDVLNSNKEREKQSSEINKKISNYRKKQVNKVKSVAEENEWEKEDLLKEILLLTYTSYVTMLESRNVVWNYDYMTFSRRIGELWEPFCKLPFEYSIKKLSLINPPSFDVIQEEIKKKAINYISELDLTTDERNLLIYYYKVPWGMVDSGGVKLALDLHFEQDGVHYNCDFKSGFSSNEKGNTNRLLLVSSIYHSLDKNEKMYLFVRQDEDENNSYLQILKNSPYWEVFCADDCYDAIKKFTGFDLRKWLDENVDWVNDISEEFKTHLEKNDLLKYLTW